MKTFNQLKIFTVKNTCQVLQKKKQSCIVIKYVVSRQKKHKGQKTILLWFIDCHYTYNSWCNLFCLSRIVWMLIAFLCKWKVNATIRCTCKWLQYVQQNSYTYHGCTYLIPNFILYLLTYWHRISGNYSYFSNISVIYYEVYNFFILVLPIISTLRRDKKTKCSTTSNQTTFYFLLHSLKIKEVLNNTYRNTISELSLYQQNVNQNKETWNIINV